MKIYLNYIYETIVSRVGDEKWCRLLDELKQRQDLRTDALLAEELGISPAVLAHARVGRQPLPLKAKVELWSKLGNEFTRDALLELLPQDVQEMIRLRTGTAAKISGAPKARKVLPRVES